MTRMGVILGSEYFFVKGYSPKDENKLPGMNFANIVCIFFSKEADVLIGLSEEGKSFQKQAMLQTDTSLSETKTPP